MKLDEAQRLLVLLREQEKILIKPHAWRDHPNRGFTPAELRNLILGTGRLVDNRFPSAIQGSFLWLCRDKFGHNVEIVVLLEEGNEKIIIVIHAWRKV